MYFNEMSLEVSWKSSLESFQTHLTVRENLEQLSLNGACLNRSSGCHYMSEKLKREQGMR